MIALRGRCFTANIHAQETHFSDVSIREKTNKSDLYEMVNEAKRNEAAVGSSNYRTRKLSYRKDDRAMRPVMGVPKIFESP